MSATLAPDGVVDLPLEPVAKGAGVMGQLLRTLAMLAGLPGAEGVVSAGTTVVDGSPAPWPRSSGPATSSAPTPSVTPPRHIDHIARHADRGPTSLANGRGVCARGNYVRELPGWQVERLDSGTDRQHLVVAVTTPTGHTYLSQAPQPP